MITRSVNATRHRFGRDPSMPLPCYLRNELESTGTKYGWGRVVQGNCPDYQVTCIHAAPHTVDVHLEESGGSPGDVGEPVVPQAGASIGNSIFATTGVLVRSLPVGTQLNGWSSTTPAAATA